MFFHLARSYSIFCPGRSKPAFLHSCKSSAGCGRKPVTHGPNAYCFTHRPNNCVEAAVLPYPKMLSLSSVRRLRCESLCTDPVIAWIQCQPCGRSASNVFGPTRFGQPGMRRARTMPRSEMRKRKQTSRFQRPVTAGCECEGISAPEADRLSHALIQRQKDGARATCRQRNRMTVREDDA